MKTNCKPEELYNAIPRSKEKAASARDLATVNDWYMKSVITGIENISQTIGRVPDMPGVLESLDANKQQFYWLEGATERTRSEPVKKMTWQKYMSLIPFGEENAIPREQISSGISTDRAKHFIARIRSRTEGTDRTLRSKAMERGKYVYWMEWRCDSLDGLIRKLFEFDNVIEAKIVVLDKGVKNTFEKVKEG